MLRRVLLLELVMLLAFCRPLPAALAQDALPPTADNYTLTLPGATNDAAGARAGSVQFIGTATVLIRYQGITVLTDPDFLPKGGHARLGYGWRTQRLTNPAIGLDALPPVDLVILSHMHEDHFDRQVQQRLRRYVPIVTTKESGEWLEKLGFTQRYGLSRWDSLTLRKGEARVRVTALPARHGPHGAAILMPTVMGSMLDFDNGPAGPAYRIYISGDTVVYDELAQIPRRFPDIDLALLHLGGSRMLGLVKVTMDGKDGVTLLRLIAPQRAIPLHYNDYDVYQSPLGDFEREVAAAGLASTIVYLKHGQTYGFQPGPH